MTKPDSAKRVAIIGAGIAGLAAAYHLLRLRPDLDLTIFESTARAGGVLETIYDPPYLIERSADNFATMIPDAQDLCRATGYSDELISPQEHGRQAFVLNRGRILPIPVGFSLVQPTRVWPILTTGTLSVSGKLRMLAEYFVPARKSDDDESLQSFATRRLGKEAFENLVEPIVSGIFTADPQRLSMQATLPQFVNMERTHGGLIRGYLAARRDDAAAVARRASGARYDQFMAPRRGMSHWIDHLVRQLPTGCLHFNEPVLKLETLPSAASTQWQLHTVQGAQSFDGLVMAAPARPAAKLLADSQPQIAGSLNSIEYASSAVAVVVVDRRDVTGRIDGFGLIVPAKEKRPVLAISYTSNKYAGRTPDDQLLLRVFLGGALRPELVDQSDEELLAITKVQLREILGWHGSQFRWQAIVRWREAMPQYHVGHNQRIGQLMKLVDACPAPLRLCGAGYSGVGIPQTIRSSRHAAEQLAAAWAK